MTNEFKARIYQIRFVVVCLVYLLVITGIAGGQENADAPDATVQPPKAETEVYPVPPPLIYQGLFPCQACHRSDARGVSSQLEKGKSFLGKYIRTPDPRPRILVRMHTDVSLKHAEWHWCLNCHSTYERNSLHLITGENISFEQSYRLCGQCHGTIYRDWKIGIHGRRVGQWNGKKLYLLCAHCHDPHKPRFRKLPGKKPPRFIKPERWKTVEHHE
jgi:hypothetical protein